jgi:putative SOS response-associated peptidase YedK
MCGRYSFAPKVKQLEAQLLDLRRPAELAISFNIAPTHTAYVVGNDDPLALQRMEWGLVPYWSRDGKNKGQLINARAESIAEKPSFRDPVRSRRCLVPADSFYEWRGKIPQRILLKNEALLWMAGIWDEWPVQHPQKRTFSIITTSPNEEMSELHDRMPVILTEADARDLWLSDAPLENVLPLLRPLPNDSLRAYRVSDRLNKPGVDGLELHEEMPEEWRLF